MFQADPLRGLFRERPFQPVRLIASEGLRYDIYHPDGVIVTDRHVMIGIPQGDDQRYHSEVRVALVHVVAVENIPPVPAGSTQSDDA